MKKTVINLFTIFVVVVSSTFIRSYSNGTVYAFSNGKDIHKNFKVEKGKKLLMNLKTGGSISITGWNKDEVEVDASINGRDWEECQVNFAQTSSGIEITSKYKHNYDSHSGNARFEIKVPNKFNLKLETMGGKIEVQNVDGDLNGHTMGGKINLSNLKGQIEFSTMGGSVSLTDSNVNGKLSTMGGNVLIENVKGDVSGSTMGGKVISRNVTQVSNQSSENNE